MLSAFNFVFPPRIVRAELTATDSMSKKTDYCDSMNSLGGSYAWIDFLWKSIYEKAVKLFDNAPPLK